MMLEVKSAVKNCKQCLHHDGDSVRAPLVPIEATGPMDLLHLDFTKIEVSGDRKKELKKKPEVVNVLMVTNHFTQHTMASVMEDTTAHTVARVLYHHYFYIFGTLLRLMTDNDLAFTSEVVQELCNLFGVNRVRTSAYHPQSNGAIEQQHQTVIKMIGRLSQDEKANWPKHLPKLIQAYSGTRSAIMGYSPHYLLFGYRPSFPIDLHFPTICKRHVVSVDNFVITLQQHLSEVLNEAHRQNVLEAHQQKRYYDHRSSTVVLKPGDIVLLKTDSYMGRRKTKNKWSYENYTVLHQLGPDILTYKIQAEGGLTCIVHRNRLFLLLPKEEDDNCMPLVAALQTGVIDSLGQSPVHTPSELDLVPEEDMRMLEVVDTCGLGYARPQTQPDLVTPGLPDLEEGHVS